MNGDITFVYFFLRSISGNNNQIHPIPSKTICQTQRTINDPENYKITSHSRYCGLDLNYKSME